MSSELLGGAENTLKGNLGGAWDIKHGYADAYTDLGIARRFGGSAAAYSLRDIGAMNGRVVKVRRDLAGEENDAEEDFSASQVQSGALEDWVNGKLENLLPASPDEIKAVTVTGGAEVADTYVAGTGFTNSRSVYTSTTLATPVKFVFTASSPRWIIQKVSDNSTLVNSTTTGEGELYPTRIQNVGTYFSGTGTKEVTGITAGVAASAAYSLRKVNASYASNAVRIRRSSDDVEVNVAFDSDDKVSTSSAISVVSGSTSATTIGDFLNPTYTVGTSVNSSLRPFDSFTSNGNDGFTATNDATGSATGGFPYTFATGDVISVSFDLVIADSASPTFLLSGNNMGSGSLGTGTTFTSSGSYTQELTTTSGTGTHLAFTDGNSGTFTVSNFKVTSHKAEAFVHTWYDQAGSNNAVQTTSANQPKIAESGALLADGLKFDGSNDDLITASIGTYQSSNGHGGFAVYKKDAASTSDSFDSTNPMYLYQIGNSLNTTTQAMRILGGKLYSIQADTNGDGSAFIDRAATTHTIGTNKTLSSIVGSSQMAIANNGVPLAVSGSESGDSFNSTSNTLIRIGSQTSSTRYFDGSVEEVILYTSDQSNNRFKIESNINNYYSLYNDANETSATEFSFLNQRSGGVTVSNGVSGLTLDVETASAFAGFQLKEKVIVDDIIYLSFNADLTGGSGGTASPKVALRETSISNTVRSNQFDITEGFNTVELTSTNANAEYLVFSEGDDNRIFTISDLKVSRIERNGFVPTWYDQSTSGNNCTQISASLQPFIVSNGGFCGVFMAEIVGGSEPNARHLRIDDIQTTDLGNNFGLIWVGRVDDTYSTTHFTTLVGANRNIVTQNQGTVGINLKLASDEFQLKNETSGSAGVSSGNLAISYTAGDRVSVAGTCVGPDGDGDHTLKAYVNGATPVSNNDTLVLTDSSDDLRIMASNFSNTVRRDRSTIGKVDEVIIFASNIEPDMEEVRAEINNHYNIY